MSKHLSGRNNRLIQEKRHDVYQERQKWPEPTHCTVCGAVFITGRWTWQTAPEKAYETICPACRRIADRFPAGYLEIKGDFYTTHQVDILNLIHNVEKQEQAEHPLERIIAISTEEGFPLITTTGTHLARRIGAALSRAYKGELHFQYADAGESIRVHWRR
jgi:hypothetical protein